MNGIETSIETTYRNHRIETMRKLSIQDLLRIWERGLRQHPIDRALTILAVAFPEKSRDELAALSIGQRDKQLLDIREQTFGATLNLFFECPQCAEQMEFPLATADIRVAPPSPPTPLLEGEGPGVRAKQEFELVTDDFVLRFRPPNSFDLAAIAGYQDVNTARRLLVQRCVLQISRGGVEVYSKELPEEVVAKLAARLAECDPQTEVLLDPECPSCGHHWQMIFDIVSFFWTEISAQAKRLLRDVHTLARFYGWREADILSMSAARRQFYLEIVNSNG